MAFDLSLPAPMRESRAPLLGIRTDVPLMIVHGDLTPESGVGTLLNAQAALAARGVVGVACCCAATVRSARSWRRKPAISNWRTCTFSETCPPKTTPPCWSSPISAWRPRARQRVSTRRSNRCCAALRSLPRTAEHCRRSSTTRVGGLVEPNDHERLADAIQLALDEQWKKTKGPHARQKQPPASPFAIASPGT